MQCARQFRPHLVLERHLHNRYHCYSGFNPVIFTIVLTHIYVFPFYFFVYFIIISIRDAVQFYINVNNLKYNTLLFQVFILVYRRIAAESGSNLCDFFVSLDFYFKSIGGSIDGKMTMTISIFNESLKVFVDSLFIEGDNSLFSACILSDKCL